MISDWDLSSDFFSEIWCSSLLSEFAYSDSSTSSTTLFLPDLLEPATDFFEATDLLDLTGDSVLDSATDAFPLEPLPLPLVEATLFLPPLPVALDSTIDEAFSSWATNSDNIYLFGADWRPFLLFVVYDLCTYSWTSSNLTPLVSDWSLTVDLRDLVCLWDPWVSYLIKAAFSSSYWPSSCKIETEAIEAPLPLLLFVPLEAAEAPPLDFLPEALDFYEAGTGWGSSSFMS